MSKQRSIGGVYAELTLRDAKFRQGVGRAMKSLGRFGVNAAKVGAVATGALAAGLAVGTKRTIKMGAELNHLSTQTGVAVGDLMRIQQAYKDNGKAAGTAGKDINKMQRAIAEAARAPGTTMDHFADMKTSAEELLEMDPAEAFFTIGQEIAAMENPTEAAAKAMDIFGRSGGELLTVFKGSSLDDVNRALGKMPEVMQKFSKEMERADTLMGRLPNKSAQFFTGFTAGVINQILPALDKIDDHDFTDRGLNLGNAIGKALSPDQWRIWGLHGLATIFDIGGKFTQVFQTAFDIISQLVQKMGLKMESAFHKAQAVIHDATGNPELAVAHRILGNMASEKSQIDIGQIVGRSMASNSDNEMFKASRALSEGASAMQVAFDAIRTASGAESGKAPKVDPKATEGGGGVAQMAQEKERYISDFQRRGLSMSKDPAKIQDKVLKVQEKMLAVLERAEINGGLKWEL